MNTLTKKMRPLLKLKLASLAHQKQYQNDKYIAFVFHYQSSTLKNVDLYSMYGRIFTYSLIYYSRRNPTFKRTDQWRINNYQHVRKKINELGNKFL